MEYFLIPYKHTMACQMVQQFADGHYPIKADTVSRPELSALAHLLELLADVLYKALQGRDPAIFFKSISVSADKFIRLSDGDDASEFTAVFGRRLDNTPMIQLLAVESQELWSRMQPGVSSFPKPPCALLSLLASKNKVVPTFCYFTAQPNRDVSVRIIVPELSQAGTVAQSFFNELLLEVKGPYYRDAQLLQDVYDYIRQHTFEKLPSSKLLARQFYTNRQKLKLLFRHVLHTTMYAVYNEARLQEAYRLIMVTRIPLADISSYCGFSSFHWFSIVFYQHFGIRPTQVERPERF